MTLPFRYRILVCWSEPDHSYVARVPALPGVAAHSTSAAGAVQEALVAAAGMLEVMRSQGREIPEPQG